MRSNVTQYDLIAPNSLDAVLQILADSPDHYPPIAGGTELMVALGAGRLQTRKLVSPSPNLSAFARSSITIGNFTYTLGSATSR